MSTRTNFADRLARLNEIHADPELPGAEQELRTALNDRSNLLAARAAEIILEWELTGYEADLVRAFDRFMIDPVRSDPTCSAKLAIARALVRLNYTDADFFLRGMRHIQAEASYGLPIDTAAGLRAVCAGGYIRLSPVDGLLEVAELLLDNEPDARIGAVRAIAEAAAPGGVPLLWYKTLRGDPETTVLFECFTALLSLRPEKAIDLVGSYLATDDPDITGAAALALGSSRLPEALPLLTRHVETVGAARSRTSLTAIGLHGSNDAFAFLLDRYANCPANEREAMLAALAPFRENLKKWRKVERVAAAHAGRQLD